MNAGKPFVVCLVVAGAVLFASNAIGEHLRAQVSKCDKPPVYMAGTGMVPAYVGNGTRSIYRICRQAGSGYIVGGRGLALEVYVDKTLAHRLPYIKRGPKELCEDFEGETIEVQVEGAHPKHNVKALWASYARCYP